MKNEKKPLSGQSSRMTPLGRSVSAGQVSRFYEVKSQKAFERTKFASDPAWTERSVGQVSRFHAVKSKKGSKTCLPRKGVAI